MIIVVVNHWGGVPHAVHGNAMQPGRALGTQCDAIALPRLDPHLGFRAAVAGNDDAMLPGAPAPAAWFAAFRRAGFYTRTLGAWGGMPSAPARDGDARHAMRAWDVDECSPFDGATYLGAAWAHDEQVLAEARRIVERTPSDTKLVLWLNLLACRDVPHMSTAPGALLAVPPAAGADPRGVPPNAVVQLPDALASAMAAAPAAAEEDYPALVREALAVLDRLAPGITALFVAALQHPRAAVALTATHSLAIGEHGCRGGGVPTRTGATSFWCASTGAVGGSVEACLHGFAVACGVDDVPAPPAERPCLGLVAADTLAARLVVRRQGRTYAVLALLPLGPGGQVPATAQLLAIYDYDADPWETTDVLATTPRALHDALRAALDRVLPRSVGGKPTMLSRSMSLKRRKAASVTFAPPASAPAVPAEPAEPAMATVMAPPSAAFPAPPVPAPLVPAPPLPAPPAIDLPGYALSAEGPKRSQSIRGKELRINAQHR